MQRLAILFLVVYSHVTLAYEAELEDAAEAAPQHITENASYMIWGGDKYVSKITGTNEFVCLVLRDGKGRFEPSCLNKAAMKSIFPVYEFEAQMLQNGKNISDIHKAIEERFKQGQFEAPAPGALVYMMSKRNRFYNHFEQKLVDISPHIMLYLPKVGQSSLGLNGHDGLPGFYNEYPHLSVIHIGIE